MVAWVWLLIRKSLLKLKFKPWNSLKSMRIISKDTSYPLSPLSLSLYPSLSLSTLSLSTLSLSLLLFLLFLVFPSPPSPLAHSPYFLLSFHYLSVLPSGCLLLHYLPILFIYCFLCLYVSSLHSPLDCYQYFPPPPFFLFPHLHWPSSSFPFLSS